MKICSPEPPYGFAIFCDDLRQEATGKHIFVGVYNGQMIGLGSYPITLNQLVVVAYYFEGLDESEEPVFLKIFLPGDKPDAPTINTRLPVEQYRAMKPPPEVLAEGEPDNPLINRMMFPIGIAPVVIKEPGLIKVRAYRGDCEIRMGTMRVMAQPGAMAPQVPEPPVEDEEPPSFGN